MSSMETGSIFRGVGRRGAWSLEDRVRVRILQNKRKKD